MNPPATNSRTRLLWLPLVLLLGACQLAAPGAPTPGAFPQVELVTLAAAPTFETVPTQTLPLLTFEAATYQDESAGFSLQYPASWMLDDSLGGGSRASLVQFSSWQHTPGDYDNPPAGGSVLSVQVITWDPKGDLEAFIATRKIAWQSSGITLLSEERGEHESGRQLASFEVQGSDGEQAFFFFTTLGEQYLSLSGWGDLAVLQEISRTLRFAD